MTVKIADRQRHQLVHDVTAHVPGNASAHPHHADIHDEAEQIAAGVEEEHEQGIVPDHCHIDMTGAELCAFLHDTDRLAGKARSEKIADVSEQGKRKQQEYDPFVFHQVAEDPL